MQARGRHTSAHRALRSRMLSWTKCIRLAEAEAEAGGWRAKVGRKEDEVALCLALTGSRHEWGGGGGASRSTTFQRHEEDPQRGRHMATKFDDGNAAVGLVERPSRGVSKVSEAGRRLALQEIIAGARDGAPLAENRETMLLEQSLS